MTKEKPECVCGEINARNCPVHQQEKPPSELITMNKAFEAALKDSLIHGHGFIQVTPDLKAKNIPYKKLLKKLKKKGVGNERRGK